MFTGFYLALSRVDAEQAQVCLIRGDYYRAALCLASAHYWHVLAEDARREGR